MARAAAVAIAIGIAAQVVAWEYPRTPLRSALANGQLAFRGRVEALTQVERHLSHTLARAHVRIGDCLYGNCAKGDVVQIDYLAQSILEEVSDCFGYPTELTLGTDVLFVFAHPGKVRGRLSFNTCLRDGSAMAYVWDNAPDGWQEDRGRYYSVYGGVRDESPMTPDEVHRMASDRRLQLRQK